MFAAVYLPSLPGRATLETPDVRAQLMAVAREFSPRVERLGDDLLALDVSGLGRWFENPRALGEALRRTAADRGLAAHIAVATTRTAALLCTRGRAGLTVVLPGEESARLAPLPLTVLTGVSLWAAPAVERAGSHTAMHPDEIFPMATFKRWGLKTLGDLASLPSVELSERLGQAGIVWQRLARGEDLQPLVPAQPDEHYEESLELEWPIDQLEPLSFVLGRLFDSLCARLEQADRGVAVLHLRLDLVGCQPFTRTLQLPAPMRDARTLRTLALLDLESNPPPAAIDRVTVAADVDEGRVLQFSLLTRAMPVERVSTLLARLSALMGSDRIGAPTLVDSYRPGAFAMAQFEAANFKNSASSASSAPSALKNPVSSVTSVVKETLPATYCQLPAAIIRRFRQPIPARVDVQQGRPVRVTTDRRHLRGGYVEVCAGPWRTSGDWWCTLPRESTLEREVFSERDQSRESAISEKWFPASPKKAPAAAATSDSECGERSGALGSPRAKPPGGVQGSPPFKRGAASARGGAARVTPSRESTLEGGVPSAAAALGCQPRVLSAWGWGPMRTNKWDRDEWEVMLRDGATYVIFQDRARGAWFIDGTLD